MLTTRRPRTPKINRYCDRAQKLVFAMLGGGAKTDRAIDSSLYGNHGVLTNMDQATDWVWDSELNRYVVGPFANAHHITLAGTASGPLDFTAGPFTLAMWGNVASGSAFRTIIARRNSSQYQWQFRVDSSGNISLLRTGGSVVGGAWPTGVNTHGAVVVNADGTGQFYINGSPSGAAFASKAITHYDIDVQIGNCQNNDVPWLGTLGDVMAWNRALSPSEIAEEADPSNVTHSGLILPPHRLVFPSAGGGATYNETINDSCGMTDAVSKVVSAVVTFSDPAGLADDPNRMAVAQRVVSDAMGLTDSVARIVDAVRTFADTQGMADAASRIIDGLRNVSDSVGMTDAITTGVDYNETIDDACGLVDAMAAVAIASRTLTDGLGIADAIERTAAIHRTLSDSLTITDLTSRVAAAVRIVADVLGVTDAAAAVFVEDVVPVLGPYRVVASEVYTSGAVVGQVFGAGAVAGQIYSAGAVAGMVV